MTQALLVIDVQSAFFAPHATVQRTTLAVMAHFAAVTPTADNVHTLQSSAVEIPAAPPR
jgi:nicotinamidase-related amidase